MIWTVGTIETTHAAAETLGALLCDTGAGGVEIIDPEEYKRLLERGLIRHDFIAEGALHDESVAVRFFLPQTGDYEGVRRVAEALLGELRERAPDFYGSLRIRYDTIRDEDFENNWKAYYHAFEVGSRLAVKPSWESYQGAEGRAVLEIDPKLAFGTGTHATTKLCLEWLEREIGGGERVLDLGCGSGILSVAALLLGAAEAVAVDIDPVAAATARDNAGRNGVGERYGALCADLLSDSEAVKSIGGGFDIIAANIVADVVMALAPLFWDKLRPGGRVVASGIIEDRAAEVEAALREQGLVVLERSEQDGWVALTAKKPGGEAGA